MRYKPEVKALVEWLKDEQHSMAQVAAALGYKSSDTINKWIMRNAIPMRQRPHLMAFIKGDTNEPKSDN